MECEIYAEQFKLITMKLVFALNAFICFAVCRASAQGKEKFQLHCIWRTLWRYHKTYFKMVYFFSYKLLVQGRNLIREDSAKMLAFLRKVVVTQTRFAFVMETVDTAAFQKVYWLFGLYQRSSNIFSGINYEPIFTCNTGFWMEWKFYTRIGTFDVDLGF